MTERPNPPPDEGGGNPEDGPILTPEEIDIEDDEHVTQIDDGRFVVSPDATQAGGDRDQEATPTAGSEQSSEPGDPEDSAAGRRRGESVAPAPGTTPGTPDDASLTEREVHAWLERDLAGTRSRYSFDVTAKFDDTVTQRRMASNDVVTVFESLVLWYSQGLDRDTPVEQILGILLTESSVPVRFPAASIQRLVDSTDLDRENTVGDLIEAVEAQDGFRL